MLCTENQPFDQLLQARVDIGLLFYFDQFTNPRGVDLDLFSVQTLRSVRKPDCEVVTAKLAWSQENKNRITYFITRRRRASKICGIGNAEVMIMLCPF